MNHTIKAHYDGFGAYQQIAIRALDENGKIIFGAWCNLSRDAGEPWEINYPSNTADTVENIMPAYDCINVGVELCKQLQTISLEAVLRANGITH